MDMLNIAALEQAKLESTPFDYVVVPRFVHPSFCDSLMQTFPSIEQGGSFPLTALEYGETFTQLCHELEGPAFREAVAQKFQIDLSQLPTTLTVRGQCRHKDGKIHTDSKSKLITVLLYLNPNWTHAGGRLRLLRGPKNLNDMVAEVTPEMGTLVIFRNGPHAWHGHTSYEGPRRAMQLNWVCDEQAVRRSGRRHGLSAFWKRLRQRFRQLPSVTRDAA